MNFRETLASGCGHLNIELDPGMVEKFEIYCELIIKWASKINLTSIKDPRSIAVTHFIDSLTLLRHIPPQSSVLDIGSGAGLPGIPLKICLPSISPVLVDARGKRVFFMREAIRTLGLEKTRAVKARAGKEDEKIGGGFDIAVSRAVAATPEMVRIAMPLVKCGGMVLIMKGKDGARQWEKEKRMIPRGLATIKMTDELKLPVSGQSRFILGLEKLRERRK